jgi:hypothetical protein
MRRIPCRVIAAMPPDRPLNRILERHRAGCERCQQASRSTAGMARQLGDMGTETISAPEGFATRVMTYIGEQDGSDPRRPLVKRAAARYSAAGLIGLATIVALVARLLSRRRR